MNRPDPRWGLRIDVPLVLLPVRLETRFFGNSLYVRIYPDAIHIDSHEPLLTEAEERVGRTYWKSVWRAATDVGRQEAAWEQLVGLVGATRATWVARVMEPDPEGRPVAPLPEEEALPVEPVFPRLAQHAPPWGRPAVARGLPRKWYAVARSTSENAVYAESLEVQPELVVGLPPDARRDGMPADDEPLDPRKHWLADPRLHWLVDFDAAFKAGMALKLENLPELMLQQGLRLLVFGVDTGRSPLEGARLLADLLEAHGATDGFSLLAPDTPTNNSETVRSGHAPGSREAVLAARVTHADMAPPGQDSNASMLAKVLGLPLSSRAGDTLAAVRGRPARAQAPTLIGRGVEARREEVADARAVRTALWMATWGYFLRHMMSGTVDPQLLEAVRVHFTEAVSADGVLPTLRIGAQPYGLLPVMALDEWTPAQGVLEERIVTLLRRLREQVWFPAGLKVPWLHSEVTDPEALLTEVLGMHARPAAVRARNMFGPEYISMRWRSQRLRMGEGWKERLAQEPRQLLRSLGLDGAGEALLTNAVFSSDIFWLDAPLAAASTGPGALDYLQYFVDPEPFATDLRDRPDLPEGRTPLLYRLLRLSMLRELSHAAHRLGVARQIPGALEPLEPELIDVLEGPPVATLWRRLETQLPEPGGTVEKYLASEMAAQDGELSQLAAFRAAVQRLAGIPSQQLERHVAGVLGLASYRLDAWLTACATRRLLWFRERSPEPESSQGIHLGGYGWVVGLKPDRAVRVTGPAPEGEGEAPVVVAPHEAGYIHAPSVQQALTSAVLRSGWRSHRARDEGNPLAIDLGSRRVRMVEFLLEGIRQGQPLGALLGYRFERALQEASGTLRLGRFLPRLRELAPRVATRVEEGGQLAEAIEARGVVDGLVLCELDKAGRIPWAEDPELPAPGSEEHAALRRAMDELRDALDAVGDALLAESVHHLVQGNPARAGASLEAVSAGEVAPPELEFVRTPRTGTTVTHRVVVLAHPGPVSPEQWPDEGQRQLRALASPAANRLAALLLPEAVRVRCRVTWRPPEGAPPITGELPLSALGLAPLDYLMQPLSASSPGPGELEQRLSLLAWERFLPEGATSQWRLELDLGRGPDWSPEQLSVAEFLDMVASARRLMGASRPLAPEDLSTPGRDTSLLLDPGLEEGANAAAGFLRELLANLVGQLGPAGTAKVPVTAEEARLRELLRDAVGTGVPGTVPPPPAAGAAAAVGEAAVRVRDTLARRLATHDALTGAFAARSPSPGQASTRELRDHQSERLRALLGPDLPVLPVFQPAPEVELRASLPHSLTLQEGRPWEVSRWLAQFARVREGAARLQETLTFAWALDSPIVRGEGNPLQVAQLPHRPGDLWWGLPRKEGTAPGGHVAYAVLSSGPVDFGAPLCGLAVDEWVEVMPGQREVTGLAFEHNAPGAVAPQAVLVATHSGGATAWTFASLERTLHETLDLTAVRAVDPDILSAKGPGGLAEVGQFLPAVYATINVYNSADQAIEDPAISTDFTKDAVRPPRAS
jgi:hypothetical protein